MRFFQRVHNQNGAVAPMFALSVVPFVAFTSLVIDVGYALVTRAQLQNIADAAALTAAHKLGSIYENVPFAQQPDFQLTTSQLASIEAAADSIAQKNIAAGTNISIPSSDVETGLWDAATGTFTPSAAGATGVRVTARRDGIANGPISTFFGGVVGVNTLDVSASAIAALTGTSRTPPGGLGTPFAISEYWFTQGTPCGSQIKFAPTGTLDGCAGWHTFTESPANASTLSSIVTGLEDGAFQSPETIVNKTQFEFTGGTVSSAFDELESLFNANKDANGEWKVLVPVYKRSDCSNPSGPITISGFSTAVITEVLTAPDKKITATVMCDIVDVGRGGGANFGTKGSIPTLVQ